MKQGLTILNDFEWVEARSRWVAAEEMGFDHAWSYDHLVWGGMPDAIWRSAIPTLSAVAALTSRIQLGTAVSAPNFRHPYTLHREAHTLNEVSQRRFILGVGAGGDLDSRILGQPELDTRARVDRFQEFTDLLLRLRAEDHVDEEGTWFSTRDARTGPSSPQPPLIVAANGNRSIQYAARVADGWMTLGRRAENHHDWFAQLAEQGDVLNTALQGADRDPRTFRRYLMLDSSLNHDSLPFSLSSVDLYQDLVGRAEELGFTDVVTHWPRSEPPYAGDERVLEQVASHLATVCAVPPAVEPTSRPGNGAQHEQGSQTQDRNQAMSTMTETNRTTQLPWVAAARTGWAAKQAVDHGHSECHHCGQTMANCEGCGDLRCLTCEPYLSDDCRWTI